MPSEEEEEESEDEDDGFGSKKPTVDPDDPVARKWMMTKTKTMTKTKKINWFLILMIQFFT